MDDDSVTAYFRSFVEEIVKEFELMARLKGTSNIVSYEDHSVVQHENGIGWDILIRMELLTPLLDYSAQNSFTRQTITKLGIDMCQALELCQKFNIIHRDIKPENIFVSELGNFKLGDFGVARTIEKTSSGLSKKGTYTYMAPEVYREEAYGSSVDIYSLGIVMYRLLNDNRAPFLPAYPAQITYSDQEAARAKRISGAKLPAPKNADGRIAEIVLKACAYDPKDRYSSPMQMRQELEAIQYSPEEAKIIYPQGDETPIKSLDEITDGGISKYGDKAVPVNEGTVSLFGSDTEDNNSSKIEPIMDMVMCLSCNTPFSTNNGARQICPNCGYDLRLGNPHLSTKPSVNLPTNKGKPNSFIFGIVSLCLIPLSFWLSFFTSIPGVVLATLAIMSYNKEKTEGINIKAGFIMGIIGLSINELMTLILVWPLGLVAGVAFTVALIVQKNNAKRKARQR